MACSTVQTCAASCTLRGLLRFCKRLASALLQCAHDSIRTTREGERGNRTRSAHAVAPTASLPYRLRREQQRVLGLRREPGPLTSWTRCGRVPPWAFAAGAWAAVASLEALAAAQSVGAPDNKRPLDADDLAEKRENFYVTALPLAGYSPDEGLGLGRACLRLLGRQKGRPALCLHALPDPSLRAGLRHAPRSSGGRNRLGHPICGRHRVPAADRRRVRSLDCPQLLRHAATRRWRIAACRASGASRATRPITPPSARSDPTARPTPTTRNTA